MALVLVTGGMIATLGIVGLTLDGGRYYETRRQLQNAVDAAAHAGAQELPDTTAAETKAQQYWDLNKPAVADSSTIVVTFPDAGSGWADARIQIDVDATVNFSLLSLLGKPSGTVGAFAEAGAQVKDIVVVLDRSGSMCSGSHYTPPYNCDEPDRKPSPDGDVTPAWSWDPIRSTQEAAVTFSTFFTPVYDRLGLVSYSRFVTLDEALTTDFNDPGDTTFDDDTINGCINCSEWADEVLELQPNGSTNIGYAIEVAQNELLYGNGRANAAKIMVVMTDGIANRCYSSGSSSCDAEAYAYNQAVTAANNGISIYTIGLGPSVNDTLLQNIANAGGGIYLNAPTADDLESTFEAIADAIRIRILQ